MTPHETTYQYKRLFFTEKSTYVIIGANQINKEIYQTHKQIFDYIIELGDIAWNEKIPTNELTNFVLRLEQNKAHYC